jgi:hypothetical protein
MLFTTILMPFRVNKIFGRILRLFLRKLEIRKKQCFANYANSEFSRNAKR